MDENENPSSGSTGTPTKPAKAYSCIRCFERKVKCDRESPCSHCSKSGSECIFRVPPPPRRRKKRTQEDILKARLTHYEDILRARGIDVHKDGVRPEDLPETANEIAAASSNASDVDKVRSSPKDGFGSVFVRPKLIVDENNRTRFVDNNLWTSMADEFRKPSDAMPDSSDDEDDDSFAADNSDFVLGMTPNSTGIRDLHPIPEQVFTLWQIFLDNVNPLSKIVHVPSLQPMVIEASSHLDTLPKNFEALIFSIYSMAVLSIPGEDCEAMLGEPKPVLLNRYRTGTKRALARAKFLGTSDFMVLQAFVLHLLCMRDAYDSRTLWTLTGVGNRIAEMMGIHRDGTNLGLGPFETEMRRRIWWQLVFLEFRTAELSGSQHTGSIGTWDVQVPLNVDDSDLYPGMKQLAVKDRGTEMIFCLTRYELGQFWKTKLLTKNPQGDFGKLWHNFRQGSTEEKEKGIEELEQMLHQKFLRFCDPSIPIDHLAMLVVRAATSGMRLMARHPRRYAKEEDVPDTERQLLWSLTMKMMEIDNMLHSSKVMKRFTWHSDQYFQWQALIYILTELRRLPLHERADSGWQMVNDVYAYHVDFVTDVKKPIHFAVGSLCLKAWDARAKSWSERSLFGPLRIPEYIARLRLDREEKPKSSTSSQFQAGYFGAQQVLAPSNFMQMVPQMTSSQTELMQSMQPHNLESDSLYIPQTYNNSQPPQMPSQTSSNQVSNNVDFFVWPPGGVGVNAVGSTGAFNFNQLNIPNTDLDTMDWNQWDYLLSSVKQG